MCATKKGLSIALIILSQAWEREAYFQTTNLFPNPSWFVLDPPYIESHFSQVFQARLYPF